MSNSVYPILPGITWPTIRRPKWETDRFYSRGGRLFTHTHWAAPIWVHTLSYDFLRRKLSYTEVDTLMGFFNSMRGGWDSFLFSDPVWNAVSAMQMGVGDGVTTDFALTRAIGGFTEPVGAKNGTITVTLNGSPTSAYTLIDDRVVRFNSAPGAGVVVRWTGSYYMRCVFVNDEMSFEEFVRNMHFAEDIQFETVKP